mmetsp:Transcript_41316/g.29774  ORF Transcript_41316/g.29774 Transcript_41316/m.29774 type:complete len:92 (+) Transcript_41316:2546-2821(+)
MLAAITFSAWMRLAFMLQLTTSLGPLTKTIVSMVKDLASFMVIYMLSCVAWASLGILMFPKLDDFANFFDVIFAVFRISNGNWDHTIFDSL